MNELIGALIEVIKNQTERDKAFADSTGSWSYFGYHIEEELAQAKAAFEKALNNAIDKRISEKKQD